MPYSVTLNRWSNSPLNRLIINKTPYKPIETPRDCHDSHPVNGIDNMEDLYKLISAIDHPFNGSDHPSGSDIKTVTKDGDGKFLVLGEAPGAQENEQGIPFVGRSGQLLRKTLSENNLKKEDMCFINVVNHRPCRNATPSNNDIAYYKPYLEKHIELLKPIIILTVGSIATRALLGMDLRITKVRGNIQIYNDIPLMPTLHPSFVLRQNNYNGTLSNFQADIKDAIKKFYEIC